MPPKPAIHNQKGKPTRYWPGKAIERQSSSSESSDDDGGDIKPQVPISAQEPTKHGTPPNIREQSMRPARRSPSPPPKSRIHEQDHRSRNNRGNRISKIDISADDEQAAIDTRRQKLRDRALDARRLEDAAANISPTEVASLKDLVQLI